MDETEGDTVPENKHIATSHEDTTTGAVHCFQVYHTDEYTSCCLILRQAGSFLRKFPKLGQKGYYFGQQFLYFISSQASH